MDTRVFVDPRNNYLYTSFYIEGLRDLYGRSAISYTYRPFVQCKGTGMHFIIQDGNKQVKYCISTNDSYEINADDYEWCDIYGNVNANFSAYPADRYPKQVSLCPSFGVRIDNFYQTMRRAVSVFASNTRTILYKKEWDKQTNRMVCKPYANIKHHFGRSYFRTWQNRLPLSAYDVNIPSENNYVFFLSTLWYSNAENKNDEQVNLRRARFIRASRSIGDCCFEGGLLGDAFSSNELFSDVLVTQKESFVTWLEKTKRSALVFNTPAFWNCHGWKLGEYLALGKCIVSTPLYNDLPAPLEHGVNIHFVEDNEVSMREAVAYILAHPDYRRHLEQGAREYWERYGTPLASLRLLGIND